MSNNSSDSDDPFIHKLGILNPERKASEVGAALPDELGGDPLDLLEGDIVVNARGEVRIVLSTTVGFLWLDPVTGVVHDHDARLWMKWAGEQLWFLTRTPDGWGLRSPFADRVERGRSTT